MMMLKMMIMQYSRKMNMLLFLLECLVSDSAPFSAFCLLPVQYEAYNDMCSHNLSGIQNPLYQPQVCRFINPSVRDYHYGNSIRVDFVSGVFLPQQMKHSEPDSDSRWHSIADY